MLHCIHEVRAYQYTVYLYIYIYIIYGLHFRARHPLTLGTLHPILNDVVFSSAGPRLGISWTWIGPRDELGVYLDLPFVCKTWPAFFN